MLCRQSGTLSLTKSGHPTPSHPSNHHLKLIFFGSPTDCVCLCRGETERERGEGGGREGEKEGERVGELVVYREVWHFFFLPLILFHVMGLVLRRRNGIEKNIIIITIIFPVEGTLISASAYPIVSFLPRTALNGRRKGRRLRTLLSLKTLLLTSNWVRDQFSSTALCSSHKGKVS